MKVIVIGAGGATRDLLRGLGDVWEVTVVDTDEDRLVRAEGLRPLIPILGDGSSTAVLDRAGIEQADALVAATDDDEVNLAACRRALDVGVDRVTAVAAESERLADYREIEVAASSSDRLAARRIENYVEPRRISSAAFADGLAEAIEFRIAADSPVRGKALRDLHPEKWVVVSILREGRLIVPHGGTLLQAEDLVTVVGAATDYSLIVRSFTAGEARFPLDFGGWVAAELPPGDDLSGPVLEAEALTRISSAEGLLLLHERPPLLAGEDGAAGVDPVEGRLERLTGVSVRTAAVEEPSEALLALPTSESIGVLVVRAPVGGRVVGRKRTIELVRRLHPLKVPVLFSRGTQPYRRLVVQALDTPAGWAAARVAVDLAVHSGAELIGVAVVQPAFMAGSEDRERVLRAIARLREEAAMSGVAVIRRVEQGNPVRVLEEAAAGPSLLVLGMPARIPTLVTPGTVGHLIRRAPSSVLVVPSHG